MLASSSSESYSMTMISKTWPVEGVVALPAAPVGFEHLQGPVVLRHPHISRSQSEL